MTDEIYVKQDGNDVNNHRNAKQQNLCGQIFKGERRNIQPQQVTIRIDSGNITVVFLRDGVGMYKKTCLKGDKSVLEKHITEVQLYYDSQITKLNYSQMKKDTGHCVTLCYRMLRRKTRR